MRTGTKASLVKVLKEHTKVTIIQELPKDEQKTSVVIDAMYAIRHWSFQKGEAFGAIAERYQRLLLKDVPISCWKEGMVQDQHGSRSPCTSGVW